MCRNIGVSEYWVYRCRNSGHNKLQWSEYWVFGILGCQVNVNIAPTNCSTCNHCFFVVDLVYVNKRVPLLIHQDPTQFNLFVHKYGR